MKKEDGNIVFEDHLRKNEEIQWSDKPKRYITQLQKITIALTLVFALIISTILIVVLGSGPGGKFSFKLLNPVAWKIIISMLGILFVPTLLIVAIEVNRIKKTRYALTNSRILISYSDQLTRFIEYSNILELTSSKQNGRHGTVNIRTNTNDLLVMFSGGNKLENISEPEKVQLMIQSHIDKF